MENEPINWQQLVKYLNNPQDPVLEQDMRHWRAASTENEAAFLQVQQLWQLSPDLKILEQLDIHAASTRLQEALPADTVMHTLPQRRYKWFRIAAITIPVIVAAWWLYSSNNDNYIAKSTQAAIDSLRLPDHSIVYLDKNSQVRYISKMQKKRIVVMEQGTAFFNVSPDATGAPFTVKIGNSSITVLGTSFNVQLKDNSIGVTVKSGKVKFAAGKDNQQETILSAGEGITYVPATGALEQFNAINNNEDAWITHELVFVDAPLSEVCKKVETLYQVKIILQGKIPVKKLNATFKDNKLGEVLEILQATYPISVAQHDRTITITGR